MSSGLPEPANHATLASSVREAFSILASGAPDVARSLVDLATGAKSELVRVQAATAVLSRVGLPEKVDVGITATHLVGDLDTNISGTAAEMVRARLRLLQSAAAEAEVLEGEVVSDPEETSNVVQLFPAPEKE